MHVFSFYEHSFSFCGMSQSKIIAIEDLASVLDGLRSEGYSIAQCHGVFDLVHPGHIRHLAAAKKSADILVVTLTPDRFVNKGPGRPLFNEQMRMESLAALESVDYVAVNHWPTAVEAIHLLRPHFFVKGQDSQEAADDAGSSLAKEAEAVREVGGDLIYTEEVAFSSTRLINSFFSPLADNAQAYLRELRQQHSTEEIVDFLERLSDIRILVIGDTIVDEYHYVQSLGKSSKSPTLSTKFLRAQSFAGGVLAIANHLQQFAGQVHLMTCLGKTDDQMEVIQPKLSPEIQADFFYREDGPTPTKRRYISEYLNMKVFEVTFMNDRHLPEEVEAQVLDRLANLIDDYDMVLIADFGHGMISPAIRNYLAAADIFVAVNAQTNSNNYGYNYITKYQGVDYIAIDENEIRLPFGDKYGHIEDLIQQLSEVSDCKSITLTLGQKGAVYYNGESFHRAPALATSVVDSVGAGDAVLSVTSLCALRNCPPDLITFIGNCTGALAVTILGNERPVNRPELIRMVRHLLK
ncbi:MAG: cytidyltransferase [Bacteroidetes bacterium]|nr:MAG: cytidyltransferase [Bacteroidota bacterium]